jgi:hypothetical protein
MHRYAALMVHWSREGPPAYVAVAAYLGLRRPAPKSERLQGDELLNLLSVFPGGEIGHT